VEEAIRLMVEHGIKRLPVIDDDGTFSGMVSRDSLLRAGYRTEFGLQASIARRIPCIMLKDAAGRLEYSRLWANKSDKPFASAYPPRNRPR